MPDLVIRGTPRSNWSSHGVGDYLASKEGLWLKGLIKKEWMLKQWQDSVAYDAHASCEMGYQRDRASALVCERWQKGDDFCEVPLALPELRPSPGMAACASAWHSALSSGRAYSEEDNLAALGLGNREVTLLGGYDAIVSALPPEKAARLNYLHPQLQCDMGYAVDSGVRAALAMHKAQQPAFGLEHRPVVERRTVIVVAATHGSGISRIARRFRQTSIARFDRVASLWCGEAAYNRGYPGQPTTRETVSNCARIVANKLRDGARPGIRVLLCHEHPDAIVHALRRAGMDSYWYLYCPDEAERARRVAARRVAPDILRYMVSTWRNLYKLVGAHDELRSEEEVVQVVQALRVPVNAC
jgi:hypothetical protein